VSRFRKLSHTLWHCQYHIVWTPKYRFRILSGQVSEEVSRCIRAFCEHLKCEVVEFRVEPQVTRTAPPQTRTSAINAPGSSVSRFRCIDRVNNLDRGESVPL
jgi:putative transposase